MSVKHEYLIFLSFLSFTHKKGNIVCVCVCVSVLFLFYFVTVCIESCTFQYINHLILVWGEYKSFSVGIGVSVVVLVVVVVVAVAV